MAHIVADFALESKGLFLSGFGEFVLKWVFLSTIAFFLSCVVSFAFCQGTPFSRLV